MATTNFNFGNNIHLPAGTSTFPASGGVAIAAGSSITFNIDMSRTSSADTFTFEADDSQDGGATWSMDAAFTFPGGSYTNKQGVVTSVRTITITAWPGGLGRIRWTGSSAATVGVSGTLTS